MKKLTVFLTFLLSMNSFAIEVSSLYDGFKFKTLTLARVDGSSWLNDKAQKLNEQKDFFYNVSYTGENWDQVKVYCSTKLKRQSLGAEYALEDTSPVVDWNKVVNKKGKTKAYAIFLFARLELPNGTCDFPRSVYVISKNGTLVNDSDLQKKHGISIKSLLGEFYLENNPQPIL